MPAEPLSLPDMIFLLVTHGAAGDDALDVIKARNPEGESVPVAFTKKDYAIHFAQKTGLATCGQPFDVIEFKTEVLLEQLVEAQEPQIHIDPLQESESVLNYAHAGAVKRQKPVEGTVLEVRPPAFRLPDEFINRLKTVAAELPTIQTIWLMELAVLDAKGELTTDPRPLLVVEQSIPEEDENFNEAFMELGDRWCELLPRGMAVDMLPHFVPPVQGKLTDECVAYQRTTKSA